MCPAKATLPITAVGSIRKGDVAAKKAKAKA
jgi:hypothetical protein